MTVGTTWIAYKKNMEQLAKFVQLTYIIVAYSAKPTKGKPGLPMRLCATFQVTTGFEHESHRGATAWYGGFRHGEPIKCACG